MQNATRKAAGAVDVANNPRALLKPLAYGQVEIKDGFWHEKRRKNRRLSLHHGYAMMQKKGNLDNLRLAAGLGPGPYQGRNFLDSDVYKWLEAVAWELGQEGDAPLQEMADGLITILAQAQLPDGYLNSYYQAVEPGQRWADLDHGHELYCAGHLMQAAVAFERACGDTRLLEIACRFADHICETFGPQKLEGTCGHPEIEMALIELYRSTKEPRYLQMAEYFIDHRGQNKLKGLGPYGPEYHQDHLPVRAVHEASGHTVRQFYLAAGVTDLYLECGDLEILAALFRLWQDVTETKLYITGGTGSRFDGEAFGDPYELPSDQCYCEACSAIAHLMWNWRMLLVTGESRFADQMELALYNSILSSPSEDGQHYFYINPLMLREAKYLRLSCNPPPAGGFIPEERPEWHDVACCPPNIMRLFSSLPHYLATISPNGIQIHHYTPAALESDAVRLSISTEYPWQGQVKIDIVKTPDAPWILSLRIPDWSSDIKLSINNQPVDSFLLEKGYACIERFWKVGDQIELDLNIHPVFVAPNPRIDAVRSCLAIQRGPLIYCLEDCDQPIHDRLLDIEIDASQLLQDLWHDDLFGGIYMVTAAGKMREPSEWAGKLYQPVVSLKTPRYHAVQLSAIPYYLWGNRGIGPMRVWIPVK